MTAPKPRVHLEIGSRLENIELVQIAVEASLTQLRLDEETSHHIGAAIREAVANAIKHGNGMDPDKRVCVDCGLDGDELVIEVKDQGQGFDPRGIPNPLAAENLLRPNGRGIFFMKQFMDGIDFSFREGEGTILTLRKRVALPPGGAAQREEDEA